MSARVDYLDRVAARLDALGMSEREVLEQVAKVIRSELAIDLAVANDRARLVEEVRVAIAERRAAQDESAEQ